MFVNLANNYIYIAQFLMYTDISEEWKKECEHIKQICQPIDLKSFGVDKIDRNIAMEFKVVQYMTQTQKHLKKLYTNPDHFSFNRNSNIMTFDQNRVLLGDEATKDSPDNYINANFIEINNHKVIATQGPLHSTINNFWRMVDHHKVQAIFMLCERVQKQKVKCDLYWPAKIEEPLEAGDFQIKLIKKDDQNKYTKCRRFSIKNNKTNEIRQICHYQFLGWPDGDKPLSEAQNYLNKLLQIMTSHVENDQVVVVHCSAGVGRTGTLIAMAQIKILIPKIQAISIFDLVRKLREQRWAMVYTASQYEYLYEFAERETIKYFQPQAANKQEEDSSDSNDDLIPQSPSSDNENNQNNENI